MGFATTPSGGAAAHHLAVFRSLLADGGRSVRVLRHLSRGEPAGPGSESGAGQRAVLDRLRRGRRLPVGPERQRRCQRTERRRRVRHRSGAHHRARRERHQRRGAGLAALCTGELAALP